MEPENGCCSDASCGCHLDIFTTDEKCPECGGRLRLEGRAQQMSFRLACAQCSYHGPLLSQEELHRVF
ncbi:MAG: hypothetical protein ABID87_08815 [Chloroflexota bacterium]